MIIFCCTIQQRGFGMKKQSRINYAERNYLAHKKHLAEYVLKDKLKTHSETWMKDGTVDAWRHLRMRNSILPFLNCYRKASWVTVGDGRYGSDAHYIEAHGGKVLATDISDVLIKEGRRRKFISKYQKENAEKLSFQDSSFDFVFCKESFHHFPRPMLALYEMIRVAKKAVILIEPNDTPSWLQTLVVKFLGRGGKSDLGNYFNSFENAGNYVYKISLREVEKTALGIQLPEIAYFGIDDFYIKGVEYEDYKKFSFKLLIIKAALFVMDVLYKLHFRDRALSVVVIFVQKPSKNLQQQLKAIGFKIIILPKNPYI